VEEGRFRRDLYYRLAVVPIRLPPLREREGDVILLARHFLAKYGEQLKGRALTLAKDAEPLLLAHAWPGNVRELQNVVQRALLKLAGTRLGGNQLRAAELLGMNRNTLRERMRALGMKPKT
jgi:two-component system nitrogen regulation response regulator GlnG